MKGRPRIPSAIKEADGWRAHHPRPRAEPPAIGEPKRPDWLSIEAKAEWEELIPLLRGMRVLGESDGPALADLCADTAILKQARALMGQTSLLIKSGEGLVRQNPLLRIIHETSARVAAARSRFGLTPADRSRVEAGGFAAGAPTSKTVTAERRLREKLAAKSERPRELNYLQ